ncbi:MAG: hypothetical protein IM598_12060 [Chitinophagaceae bacterium]|nr:hypothetical protein [Chitinophagaceae bacterium]MCA6459026.1 hypothetical protein [Chitinophagaceae bacterium]MCA6465556.1 hypothetical protein [Chitinophagaceae bacterium]
MSKSYDEIKHGLIGLTIREQYEQLLQTSEWLQFRDRIISQNGGPVCQSCRSVEGPIEEPIMTEQEHKFLLAEIADYNRKFLRLARENPDLIKQQLQKGTYIGQKASPSRFKEVGRVIIQVHHTLYFWNRLPWEYQSIHLKVLCDACHKQEHQVNTIYVYKDETMSEKKVIPICTRCDGSGYIPEYFHIQKGICFECWGAGCLFNAEPIWEPV